MMTSRPEPEGRDPSAARAALEQAAADWVARRDRGLNAAEEAELQRWVSDDPHHAAILAEVEGTWSAINQPRLSGRASVFLRQIRAGEIALGRERRRRLFMRAGGPLLAAAAVILVFISLQSFSHRTSSFRTVTLRPDRHDLPDGSFVELNTGAEITVNFSPTRRGIELVRGEALFTVAKDSSRPFVVNAGGVEVRAVGTAFTVRVEPSKVNILVTEGRVAVERASDGQSLLRPGEPRATDPPSSPAAEAPVLAAGERIVVPVTESPPAVVPVAALSARDIAEALAWRQRRVEFTATRLADAVPLFNRENRLQLSIADSATGELRISGVFWTDDPAGFARLVASSLGVRAQRETEDTIRLRK